MRKALLSLFLIGFISTNCAMGQSLQVGNERMISQDKGLQNEDTKYEILLKRLERLEETVKTFRPSLTTYKLPQEVSLCDERFPLEDRNVWENLEREFLLTLSNEATVLFWMKRARRYFPYIEARLREMGLPDDLKYVTITESGLRPEAVSSSGAAGIWQFIPSTGERYGMRKNRSLDERFDFFKATEGALSYLKTLYEEFKSWTLSMAAYNAGENRIRKEIELQKTRNYFYLDLPLETERYVYKIAVAKIILSDPGRYGYHLEEKDLYRPLEVERIQIELPLPLPIIEVARAIGLFYKEIREMNPHLSEEAIPIGIQFLNLPPERLSKFWEFFFAWKQGLGDPMPSNPPPSK